MLRSRRAVTFGSSGSLDIWHPFQVQRHVDIFLCKGILLSRELPEVLSQCLIQKVVEALTPTLIWTWAPLNPYALSFSIHASTHFTMQQDGRNSDNSIKFCLITSHHHSTISRAAVRPSPQSVAIIEKSPPTINYHHPIHAHPPSSIITNIHTQPSLLPFTIWERYRSSIEFASTL